VGRRRAWPHYAVHRVLNLLERKSGRAFLFAALYFSEGAPIGLVWWALPTLLRTEGVELARITGLAAMLVLPWTFKFAWAPLIDTWRSPRWGFRAWIIAAQVGMGLSILPLIWLDPATNFSAWRALLLLHAFTAATQDVAIDALAINVVPEQERGALNGSMQAGMLVGRSLFGGGALLVASQFGRGWILGALVVCIWSSLALLLASREPADLFARKRPFGEFAAQLKAAAQRRTTWLGIGFALISAAAFEVTGLLAGPFLVDHGVSQQTIGVFFGVATVAATLLGAMAGGRWSDHWGRERTVARFLVAFVAVVALLGALDLGFTALPHAIYLGVLTALYFCIGLFTAASYALFMDLTDPKLGGTQFSTYMSATNACESWTGWAGGNIAARASYGASFLVMCAVSLLSLPLLARLRAARSRANLPAQHRA
jgi:MFS family permease